MKKLAVLMIIAVIVCFTAIFVKAEGHQGNSGVIQTIQSEAQCNLFFGQVLNKTDKHLEHFEEEVEYFLETGYFWEACLLGPLQGKQNVVLHYTGYIEGPQATKTEMKRLLKSAAEFKDELASYIEDQEPKHSPLHHAEKYIVLKVTPNLVLDSSMQKMLKKENKKFEADSDTGKIFIHIK